jgi:cGMP-dependent protein kinase
MNKFTRILGGNFNKLLNQNAIIDSLLKVQIFKNLPHKKLEHLANIINEQYYDDGANIITQGEEGDKFYIVRKGRVEIFVNSKYIRTLNEGECFGERALFFHEKRSATIKASGKVCVFYISQKEFMSNLEEGMKDHLMNRLYLQDNTVELKNLLFCAQLGSGNYGKVSLVKNVKNNFFYAIKSISRKQIDSEQLHTNLELERNILLRIDHPFIVKLVKTLKDKKFIYFLMEYIKGKELFDVIRDIGLLNKQQTQFYGASMMLAVDYLHERRIVYRDIKPENIIVIQSGYVKLIDFGTAKEIIDRTNTIIGTPHYMAPEVVLGEGYSFQVDIWSIAVCMYEFMCGGVPFGENAEDPMDVYLSIINDKMVFPPFCKDHDFKSLMQQMLTKNPMSRTSKLSQVKNHIWYKSFNWDDLPSLKMVAPYKPIIQDDVIKNTYPFIDYVTKNIPEYVAEKENELTLEQIKENNEWYKKF